MIFSTLTSMAIAPTCLTLLALAAPQDGEVTDRVTLPTAEEWSEISQRTPATPQPGPATLTIYDVRDLITFGQPEPAPTDESKSEEGRKVELMAETEALVTFLSDHVEPGLTMNGGTQESLRVAGVGSVLAMANPLQHAWIERVLNLHRSGQPLVHVQAKYVQGPRGCFDEYGKDGTVSFLETDEAQERFLRQAHSPGMEIMYTPQVVAFNRQLCSIQVTNQIAYVKEYRLIVVQPSSEEIADPIIDTVEEGYLFQVRPALLEEGVYALDIELTRSQVQRPIPTRKIRLSPAIENEVEISTPVCLTSTIESKLVVAEGTAVLFLSPSNVEERDMACLITVETIGASELGVDARGLPIGGPPQVDSAREDKRQDRR